MPPIHLRLAALLVLCLSVPLSAQESACPAGEKQVCLNGCICLPDLGKIAGVPDGIYQVAAPALALWLTQSRAEAASSGVQPIPAPVRERLLRWYDASVLDAVSYKISDNGQLNAANAMLQNPDIGAVTLIDIIIFRSAEDAEQNIALWAHELKHVQQYQALGVDEFARRYTRDFNELEGPAYKIEAEVAKALRERSSGQAR